MNTTATLPKAIIWGRGTKHRWYSIAVYTEDQTNYSARDHALRDAALYASLGLWDMVEVRTGAGVQLALWEDGRCVGALTSPLLSDRL